MFNPQKHTNNLATKIICMFMVVYKRMKTDFVCVFVLLLL